MAIRHTFTPFVSLTEEPDGTYTMTVDFFDSWNSSLDDNNRSLSDNSAAVIAATQALDAYLAAHPALTRPVTVQPVLQEVTR